MRAADCKSPGDDASSALPAVDPAGGALARADDAASKAAMAAGVEGGKPDAATDKAGERERKRVEAAVAEAIEQERKRADRALNRGRGRAALALKKAVEKDGETGTAAVKGWR